MINDVSELITEVSRISGRGDLATYAPMLLGFLEADLNSRLRVADMETTVTLTTDAEAMVDLPDGYLEVISATIGTDKRKLDRHTKAQLDAGFCGWRTEGGSFASSEADTDHDLTFYQAIPSLWANSTNWLLARKPEVYLRGLVFEAHKDANAADAAIQAKALYDMGVKALLEDDRTARRNDIVTLPRTIM